MKLTHATTVVALAAAVLLTACGPKGGGAAQSGGPGAAASGPDVDVAMADLPKPRAGLWKSVSTDEGGKPSESMACRSGKVPQIPKSSPGCDKMTVKKTFLGKYVMDMHCATPDFTATAHAELSGDFQNHAVMDSTMTMSAPKMPAQTVKTHIEETYVGPCAPGQTPEDDSDAK